MDAWMGNTVVYIYGDVSFCHFVLFSLILRFFSDYSKVFPYTKSFFQRLNKSSGKIVILLLFFTQKKETNKQRKTCCVLTLLVSVERRDDEFAYVSFFVFFFYSFGFRFAMNIVIQRYLFPRITRAKSPSPKTKCTFTQSHICIHLGCVS